MNNLAPANPYVDLVDHFPGRVFPIRDFTHERAELQKTASRFSESILEIGSGSGNHLITQAGLRPRTAFFGVELRFKRAVRTIEKAGRLENIFVLRMNAKLLHRIFKPQTFSGLYLNFPDPWSKRKTEKHRLLTVDFISSLNDLLLPGAFVSVKTDDAEQFERFAARLDQLKAMSS